MSAEDLVYQSYMKALPYIKGKRDADIRDPGLARKLLSALGHPETGMPVILVTGSKGKGSVSRMIAFLLERMGKKVGHFSSPHLVDFTERIRVNGRAVPHGIFEKMAEQVRPHVEKLEKELERHQYIGPIAISQAIAFLYFREAGVELAVMECGRGGRYDDTNAIPHEVAVITPVMEEHLQQLGPGLKEIVDHKLGIVTPEVRSVFVGKQREDVWALMAPYYERLPREALLFRYGIDFAGEEIETSLEGTLARVRVGREVYPPISLPLLGRFQGENFALALAVVHHWTRGEAKKTDWNLHLPQLRWPGRCEIIGKRPMILLDGGVHRESAQQVRQLLSHLPWSRCHVVLGIPADKDVAGVVDVWAEVAERIILTKASNPYLHFEYRPQDFKAKCTEIPDLRKAIDEGKKGLDENGVLVIMGTQSLVADVKRLYGESIRDL